MNEFFKAQFNYCPIIWMFYSRYLSNKINQLHERCLRISYNDKRSNFEELLVKDNSLSIRHSNIHSLATEVCRVVNGICPEIMNDVFGIRNNTHYHLRYTPTFLAKPIHSVFNGSESASYLRPKICEQISNDVEMINSLVRFKKEIRKWRPENRPCRIPDLQSVSGYLGGGGWGGQALVVVSRTAGGGGEG